MNWMKRKQNKNEKYWGKPVPGFGDNKAKLMIFGDNVTLKLLIQFWFVAWC